MIYGSNFDSKFMDVQNILFFYYLHIFFALFNLHFPIRCDQPHVVMKIKIK